MAGLARAMLSSYQPDSDKTLTTTALFFFRFEFLNVTPILLGREFKCLGYL